MARHLHSSSRTTALDDATFRAWGLQLSNALAAVGLVKTADTGQIDWATVSSRASTATPSTRSSGSPTRMQATAPVYLKVSYGTGSEREHPEDQVPGVHRHQRGRHPDRGDLQVSLHANTSLLGGRPRPGRPTSVLQVDLGTFYLAGLGRPRCLGGATCCGVGRPDPGQQRGGHRPGSSRPVLQGRLRHQPHRVRDDGGLLRPDHRRCRSLQHPALRQLHHSAGSTAPAAPRA